MKIFCCKCSDTVNASLTDGGEIYPHRPDLSKLPFWKCDTCGNHVGCHHKTSNRTRPLGCIPSPEIKNARKEIHKILDPLWEGGTYTRRQIYREITKGIGWKYHTADIKTIEDARKIYTIIRDIQRNGINKEKANVSD